MFKDPDIKEKGTVSLLILPSGFDLPHGFPFPTIAPTDAVDYINCLPQVVNGAEMVVFMIDASFIETTVKLANMVDRQVQVLKGVSGDYPSYWQASSASLPVVLLSELMLAKDNSVVAGGNGIPEGKMPKHDYKPADQDGNIRRASVLEAVKSTGRLVSPDMTPAEDSSDGVAQEG